MLVRPIRMLGRHPEHGFIPPVSFIIAGEPRSTQTPQAAHRPAGSKRPTGVPTPQRPWAEMSSSCSTHTGMRIANASTCPMTACIPQVPPVGHPRSPGKVQFDRTGEAKEGPARGNGGDRSGRPNARPRNPPPGRGGGSRSRSRDGFAPRFPRWAGARRCRRSPIRMEERWLKPCCKAGNARTKCRGARALCVRISMRCVV